MKRGIMAVCMGIAAMLLVLAGPASSRADDLKGNLEIFSWWAGDEGPALEALIDLYQKAHPGVKVINATVTGGSGVNAKAVLKTRMLGGEPPGSFQVHAGQELIGTWVQADRMEDLTALFKEEGWLDVFPKELVEKIGTEKGIWSVPVDIHRSNVLWFIPENLKKWGVEAPKTWDEFFAIAPKLQEKGVVPLCLGENWTVTNLWETLAVSVLGVEKYEALWNGGLAFDSPEVKKVWELLGKILPYTNKDASSLSWQQATDMIVDGRAAFNVMGDWVAGYMVVTKKLQPESGFGWLPAPGNDGTFLFLSDSFCLPKGAPERDNVIAWLKLLGSREGSDAFNPLKGSISPRTDSDLGKYNAYGKSAAEDFRTNKIGRSLAHGTAANEAFLNDFASVMEMFMKSKNADAVVKAAQQIARKDGIIK